MSRTSFRRTVEPGLTWYSTVSPKGFTVLVPSGGGWLWYHWPAVDGEQVLVAPRYWRQVERVIVDDAVKFQSGREIGPLAEVLVMLDNRFGPAPGWWKPSPSVPTSSRARTSAARSGASAPSPAPAATRAPAPVTAPRARVRVPELTWAQVQALIDAFGPGMTLGELARILAGQ